ncbi:MAG TPA: aminotransferase class III-fold pyridoxal phosphate-dependent enzyme [Actinomycetota bacterium]|nr:aminotransferase class III-fold pyridoxal phosphate-dependent enzyme [Actinomycetota bacterium]
MGQRETETGASHVFSRASLPDPPRVDRGKGAELWDTEGRRWLDGAGGAIVVSLGHGDERVVEAVRSQAARVAYVHGTMFTSDVLETYAAELAQVVPVDGARVYPVSGGSEAVETALKMARAYHLARGQDRWKVIGREGSYHGNTRGALDASGRVPLRRPYLPWLTHASHTLAAYEYRCPFGDTHPAGCGRRYAGALDAAIREAGPETVAAFVAEPVAGAALGAAVPPDDYWAAVAEVCRAHGVLLVADEVMTGFGRTGRWFGGDHWGVRPDILVAAKGASSGYWPLGLAVASAQVHDTVAEGGFTHGLTYSHHVVGAAAGLAVLRILREDDLIEAATVKGRQLQAALAAQLGDHPAVGDVRGIGLMVGVELVADRASREPFPRAARLTERVVAAARDRGLLLYASTGCVDGHDGDLVMLGPPFVTTTAQIDEMTELCAAAIRAATTTPPAARLAGRDRGR